MAARFPYLPRPGGNGPLDLAPYLPLRLSSGPIVVDVTGLLDTGASFSVLPYDTGNQFGIAWASLPHSLHLSGAHGPTVAKALTLDAVIASFPPVSLTFAWVRTNNYPLALGQANFFFEFDACFFRRQSFFEIQPATP